VGAALGAGASGAGAADTGGETGKEVQKLHRLILKNIGYRLLLVIQCLFREDWI